MFPDFFAAAPEIRLYDPLSAFLGTTTEGVQRFCFADVARLAGHACPTVAAAYLMTRRALQALYGEALPVRGEIALAVGAHEEEGVAGVMAGVAAAITGAAGAGGFKGLGGRFSRRDRLQFACTLPFGLLRFQRVDTGAGVDIGAELGRVPADARLSGLLGNCLAGHADAGAQALFRQLWLERVRRLLLEHADDAAVFPLRPAVG